MWLLLLEALLAMCIIVFIIGWTMWPKRRELRRDYDPGRDDGDAPRDRDQ